MSFLYMSANSPSLITEAGLFWIAWQWISSVTSSAEQLLSFTRSFFTSLLTQIIVQQLLPSHALLLSLIIYESNGTSPSRDLIRISIESSLTVEKCLFIPGYCLVFSKKFFRRITRIFPLIHCQLRIFLRDWCVRSCQAQIHRLHQLTFHWLLAYWLLKKKKK